MTSALYYQSMIVPQQQQQQQQHQHQQQIQIPQMHMYYHPQQPQQVSLPHMMQQPQQVHHLIPQSAITPTHNRDHHHQQQSHTPKEMNKPKGRMSAYTFFVQKCRDEHRKAYPNENANFSEFSKKCAEKWKTMTDDEKSKFAALAEVDKQRFEREMAVYQPGEKRKKKKKDPLAPKRPLSAFFHYCKEERPKLKATNPSLSVGEIAKELGDRWNHTEPKGKHIYEESAQRDKERYEKEMNDFRSANKKAAKSNSSSQALAQQQKQQQQQHSDQQARIHQEQQQQQQQQQLQQQQPQQPPQQQQYSSTSYQLPPFNPMQSFQPQAFAQMNNFQDNGLATSLFPHYNNYSLQMPHNNIQMQQFQAPQHLQHQTYQTLTTANTNSSNSNNRNGTPSTNNGEENDDDDDDDDDNDDESEGED